MDSWAKSGQRKHKKIRKNSLREGNRAEGLLYYKISILNLFNKLLILVSIISRCGSTSNTVFEVRITTQPCFYYFELILVDIYTFLT